MNKLFFVGMALVGLAIPALAQAPVATSRSQQIPNAPLTYQAKYEGGIYGSTGREKGTLTLDDSNARVTFRRKGDQKEMFSIPYDDLDVIYPDSKVSTSQTGNVVSRMPLPGAGLAGLLSSRAHILVINFYDPDIEIRGTANFKFDDKKKLLTFINTLGNRAKMKQRGDAFYRPNNPN